MGTTARSLVLLLMFALSGCFAVSENGEVTASTELDEAEEVVSDPEVVTGGKPASSILVCTFYPKDELVVCQNPRDGVELAEEAELFFVGGTSELISVRLADGPQFEFDYRGDPSLPKSIRLDFVLSGGSLLRLKQPISLRLPK